MKKLIFKSLFLTFLFSMFVFPKICLGIPGENPGLTNGNFVSDFTDETVDPETEDEPTCVDFDDKSLFCCADSEEKDCWIESKPSKPSPGELPDFDLVNGS